MNVFRRLLLIAILALLGTGCSTVRDYTSVTRAPYRAFRSFDLDRAAKSYGKKARRGGDRLAYLCELGVVRHTAGRFEESNAAFREAAGLVREFDQRAAISVRDTAASVGTLILNEKAAPYRGEPFERVYAHVFASLNFLMLGDFTGARVEARQAYFRQRLERLRFQAEYEEAVRRARDKDVFSGEAIAKARARYGDAPEVELFQDAFAYYLASVVYEIGGEYQNALVEIRNLLNFQGGSRLAQRQMDRLQAKWSPGTADEEARRLLPREGEGEVVVLFFCGEAPVKREIKITLPLPTGRGTTLNTVAFPKYEPRANPVTAARVSVDRTELGVTETLSDIEAKARATLAKRLPALVLKSLLRAAGRFAAQTAILYSGDPPRSGGAERTQGDAFRQLFAMLFGVTASLVEQADLRSWLTLPQSLQAVRGTAPAGRREIAVTLIGGETRTEEIEVKEGGLTVVVVRSVGSRATIHSRAF